MLDTRREVTGKISLVGHRGAAACAPENTLASFREALRQGVDIIELDVQMSVDGHVVVFHDDGLERTTDGRGPLTDRTLAELKALDAGSWFDPCFAGEPIPTLDEVLTWAKDQVPLFIELKYGADPDPALAAAVVERVVAHGMTEQVMVISFERLALRWVKECATSLATGVLYMKRVTDPVRLAQGIGASAVMPLWHVISRKEVTACHSAGLPVNVWGPDPDHAALIAMRVDCINTEHPAQTRRDVFQKWHE